MQKNNEAKAEIHVLEKLLIVFALGIILTTITTVSFAEASSYNENNISINMSSLPAIIKREIWINGNINSTLDIIYGDYLSGPEGIFFADTDRLKINITVNLPEVDEGTYITSINTTFGEKIEFNINIINDPTIDDFKLTTDHDEYITDGSVFITVHAPEDTNLSLLIKGKTEDKNYNSTVFGSAMLVFIPKNEGNYTIIAKMSHKLYNIALNKTIIVKPRYICIIKSPLRMQENITEKFEAEITGGTGPYIFKWDFDDGTYSTSSSPYHSYKEIGTYGIRLSVNDRFNNVAACIQTADVETVKYSVEIKLTDNATNKEIGDAVIKFDTAEKKSNVKGKAIFDNIEKGRHRVVIKREGYEDYTKSYQINKSVSIDIALEPKETDIKMLPKVSIISPENSEEIDNRRLSVSFSVSSSTEISSCKLLINQIPYLGYKIQDSIENISSGENTLGCDMTNADYNVKISCENIFGTATSEKINIRGINFPIEEKKVMNEEESSSDVKSELTTSAKSEEGLNNNVIDKSITGRFDKALDDIKSIETDFSSYTGTQKEILTLLSYDKKIVGYKKEIKSLRDNIITLESLNIGKSDYISQKNTILTKMEEVEKKVPSKVSIIKNKRYEPKTATTDQIRSALLEYASHLGKNFTKSKLKFYEKKSAELQDKVTIDAEIIIVNVEYKSGTIEEYSFVKKTITQKTDTIGILLIEMIPKKVAQKIDELSFSFEYEVINEDPIIKIDNIDKDGDNEIMYYVKRSVPFEELMNSTTSIIIDPTHPSNKITGFAVLSSQTQLLESTGMMIAIFAMIGIIVVTASYTTIKNNIGKIDKHKNSNRYENNKSDKMVNQKADISIDRIADGIANRYDNIKNSGRFGFQKITEFADSLNSNSDEAEKEKLLSYLDNALDYINDGQKEEAFKLYSKILPLYGPQTEELKKELSPIMNHLYNEIELYHFITLLNKAKQEIIDGMYDVGSNLNMEIEDIYNELPEHLIPRVSEQYNQFSAILNLKNFRKDTELRLNTESRRNSFAIEDEIFG
jgi:PKD repeat protein